MVCLNNLRQHQKLNLSSKVMSSPFSLLRFTFHVLSEVFKALGDTIKVVTLSESAIAPLTENEIFSVRNYL